MHEQDDPKVVVRGRRFAIEYAKCDRSSAPAQGFVSSLDVKEQAKLFALFDRLANHGEIRNREQFKQVRGPIYEFKRHQVRLLCFRQGSTWYLTNGYKKKRDRLDPGEVDRAERIMAEHLRQR